MTASRRLTLQGELAAGGARNDPGTVRLRVAERLAAVNERSMALLAEPFVLDAEGAVRGVPARPRYLPDLLQALDLGTEALPVLWIVVGEAPLDGAPQRSPVAERWVTVRGLGEERELILNALFLLLQVLREGWTARQRAAVATRWRHLTQKAAARELGVDKSIMSRRLRAAHFEEWREGMLTVRLLLRHWLEDAAGA